jgi:hypothetical protein
MKKADRAWIVDKDTFDRMKALAEVKRDNINKLIDVSGLDAEAFERFLIETDQTGDATARKIMAAYKQRNKAKEAKAVYISMECADIGIAEGLKSTIFDSFKKSPGFTVSINSQRKPAKGKDISRHIAMSILRETATRSVARTILAGALKRILKVRNRRALKLDVNGVQLEVGVTPLSSARLEQSVDALMTKTW